MGVEGCEPSITNARRVLQILDMCAAPGSKTAQILEMLHAGTMMPTGTYTYAFDIIAHASS